MEPRFRFWVPGPLPAQNEMIAAAKGFGGRGIGYSQLKSSWTSTIAWIAKAAHIPKMERIRLEFEWVSRDRRHDPDNIEAGQKFVWDALKVAGIIENDGWDQNAGSTHRHRLCIRKDSDALVEKPGVWVTVIPEPDLVAHRTLTPVVTRRLAPLVDGRHKGETKDGE